MPRPPHRRTFPTDPVDAIKPGIATKFGDSGFW